MKTYLTYLGSLSVALLFAAQPALAEGSAAGLVSGAGYIGLGAGLAIAVAALGAALGQGRAVSSALDSIGRNPGSAGKLFVPMILGLVFLETLVIFSFVIALQLIGKVG